jgi:predicted N-acetyltransferase YhbS
MIEFRQNLENEKASIAQLFRSVFADSEGPKEGEAIGRLAKHLFEKTPASDLYCFLATEGGQIIGAIFFSRLKFEVDILAYILAPVAVATRHQGKGVGQKLIRHGLAELKASGASLIITYGDPAFYTRVGFRPLELERINPPHPLSQPIGWLGQSLDGGEVPKTPGGCSCVEALDDPAYW